MRRISLVLMLAVCLAGHAAGENYLLNGGQESKIQYRLYQKVEPAAGTKSLILSFVVPASFVSPTYNQTVSDFSLTFAPQPATREEQVDKRGNRVVKATWAGNSGSVEATVAMTALTTVKLEPLRTQAPFPLTGLPPDVQVYRNPSPQVQSGDAAIAAKARELTEGARTEFDAVQRVLSWVVDHMQYVTPPAQYDALYSFHSGKGNCQNYSHLAAALLRAVGVPVRIVNGVTLKQPYDVRLPNGAITMRMGQGRHSWIEVYFPDLGWVPFDPQQTELFVSNRFIRIEVGVDNEETIMDGMIRWTQSQGMKGQPQFEESIEADFAHDRVVLNAKKEPHGPRNMLFLPEVQAVFQPYQAPPPPPPPKTIPDQEMKQLRFTVPFVHGNLLFPEGVDFMAARGPAVAGGENAFEMRKNFMVETAEYVTTQAAQYAQMFVLTKPIRLVSVGLALHRFGGEGSLWVELYKDDTGKPGAYVATSEMLAADQLPLRPGYRWVDFPFRGESLLLSPGRYWIALGFTGSPIVNWFFTYGKPVGPPEGTRYKTIFDEDWSRALSYEFNYRVQGMTTP
ncbi:MAG: transglutaminase-like domain-containing protein [candidate division KSB1 bacterium]|nr:transglutaminase-like domain-containing protein [candidate division KSB1 bacterium]